MIKVLNENGVELNPNKFIGLHGKSYRDKKINIFCSRCGLDVYMPIPKDELTEYLIHKRVYYFRHYSHQSCLLFQKRSVDLLINKCSTIQMKINSLEFVYKNITLIDEAFRELSLSVNDVNDFYRSIVVSIHNQTLEKVKADILSVALLLRISKSEVDKNNKNYYFYKITDDNGKLIFTRNDYKNNKIKGEGIIDLVRIKRKMNKFQLKKGNQCSLISLMLSGSIETRLCELRDMLSM